jgi:hypothetical protein
MNKEKRSFWKRGFAILLVAGCLWSAGAVALAEDDEAMTRSCEEALSKCLGDSVWSGLFAGLLPTILFLEICLVGYEFCVRYVAPLIRG